MVGTAADWPGFSDWGGSLVFAAFQVASGRRAAPLPRPLHRPYQARHHLRSIVWPQNAPDALMSITRVTMEPGGYLVSPRASEV